MGVLIREMGVLYEAYAGGRGSPLAELAYQYVDYAEWQRQWLQGEVLAEQLEYWKGQLRGSAGVLELPLDHARPAVQSIRGGSWRFAVSEELLAGVKELSQGRGLTMFMTLLGGFAVLLSRYSGEGDIVVGTPIANRQRSELEGMIGLFANTMVLRTEL